MNVFEQLFAGEVYELRSLEASSIRHVVANHEAKRCWVNITLPCSDCETCLARVRKATEAGYSLFNLEDMQPEQFNNVVWTEVPYPENGIEGVQSFAIFTVKSIEKCESDLGTYLGYWHPKGMSIWDAIDLPPARYSPTA